MERKELIEYMEKAYNGMYDCRFHLMAFEKYRSAYYEMKLALNRKGWKVPEELEEKVIKLVGEVFRRTENAEWEEFL